MTLFKTPVKKQGEVEETKPQLKNKHFQQPSMLCDFANSHDIDIVTIIPFDRFQVIYYYEK
jgi:hypothetical protein